MTAPLEPRATPGMFSWLSVFTSAATLVCCALPAALVAIGAGASLASLVGVFPQIVWLSEHKEAMFVSAAAMLAVAGGAQARASRAPCPADPRLAAECERARRISRNVLSVSFAIYVVGVFFAFVVAEI